MKHSYERERAQLRVGDELARRGWQRIGYSAGESDAATDYYRAASWRGVAVHPDYPRVVVCVAVPDYVARRSGTDETREVMEKGDPCLACAGSGVAADALTYEQARATPREAHHNRADRDRGFQMATPFGSIPVLKMYYFENGRAKCLTCMGRCYELRARQEVVFTWPTFHATPKGAFWHVENTVHGDIVDRGTGMSRCWSGDDAGNLALKEVVDDIERSARRGAGLPPLSARTTGDTPEVASAADSTTTTASRDGLTVTVEHTTREDSDGSIWTWVDITPRIDTGAYKAFAARFGASWSKRRRKVYIPRRVEAQALLDYLRPPMAAQPEPPQPEPVTNQATEPATEPASMDLAAASLLATMQRDRWTVEHGDNSQVQARKGDLVTGWGSIPSVYAEARTLESQPRERPKTRPTTCVAPAPAPEPQFGQLGLF
ncbi:MAG: hypothetical protein RLZZ387_1504 [Chloroflexota bacterium]|jgi:hypothetical protein